MNYDAIEADNEVLVNLIAVEVSRQAKEIDREFPKIKEDERKRLLERYRVELTKTAVKKLRGEDEISGFEDSNEDGRKGVYLTIAHVARVIGSYEREVWAYIEATEFPEKHGKGLKKGFLFEEIEERFLEKVKEERVKYDKDLNGEAKLFCLTTFKEAFRRWCIIREDEDIEDISRLYMREVELHIPYHCRQLVKGIKRGIWELHEVSFR